MLDVVSSSEIDIVAFDVFKNKNTELDYQFYAKIKNFTVKPYVRQTQRSKWTPSAQRYNQNQVEFAWELVACGKGKVTNFPVHVCSIICLQKINMASDEDNYGKAVKDALCKAKIFPDDNLRYVKSSCNSVSKSEDMDCVEIIVY